MRRVFVVYNNLLSILVPLSKLNISANRVNIRYESLCLKKKTRNKTILYRQCQVKHKTECKYVVYLERVTSKYSMADRETLALIRESSGRWWRHQRVKNGG